MGGSRLCRSANLPGAVTDLYRQRPAELPDFQGLNPGRIRVKVPISPERTQLTDDFPKDKAASIPVPGSSAPSRSACQQH